MVIFVNNKRRMAEIIQPKKSIGVTYIFLHVSLKINSKPT